MVLIIIGTIYLLKNPLYNLFIHYSISGKRAYNYSPEEHLRKIMDEENVKFAPETVEEVIDLSLKITDRHLHYRFQKSSVDPNEICKTGSTHCVGYSAFFNTTFNYLIQKNKISGWTTSQCYGGLFLFNINLNKLFDSPFFRDHDFNSIRNQKTGENIYVDPTVFDYLGIDRINAK